MSVPWQTTEDERGPKAPPTGSKYSTRYIGQNWLGSAMGGLPPAQWPLWAQLGSQNYSDVSLWVADGGSI